MVWFKPSVSVDPMPITLRGLRPEVASKLAQLEAGAEVLERDAKECREALVELGLASPLIHRQLSWLRTAYHLWMRLLAVIAVTRRAATGSFEGIKKTSPHVATGLRVTWGILREGVLYVAISVALLIPFVLGILLLAPPV